MGVKIEKLFNLVDTETLEDAYKKISNSFDTFYFCSINGVSARVEKKKLKKIIMGVLKKRKPFSIREEDVLNYCNRGLKCSWDGNKTKDMNTNQLLAFIGFLDEQFTYYQRRFPNVSCKTKKIRK